ncbi:putative SAGA complex component [Taphrina deformans PYCC 5710]|uniref:SAGA complex component n=1 Tax=Taphrina deformans (strain PYCC 5710 / ATCC 11124 / CBS 356.35 / IMI 108563 / JCM 9778 / NBRC 8474) TaxID=1097556 RepID=R4XCJ7_TAPDE|nr:putative SAGA complex component [Taphrina deformans PYCC 5710]|eukprot:CCG83551.1 putative SAGA complex component [Taphrina deformans PYCC 5710]
MAGRYDLHGGEESAIWSASVSDLNLLKIKHNAGENVSKQVNRWKRVLTAIEDEGKLVEITDKLERYSKDYAEILVNESKLLESVRENIGLLIALRQATEAGLGGTDESRRKKRKLTEMDSNIDNARLKKRGASETLIVGSSVAFRQPRTKLSEGDWIQCNIIRITGEGPKARYEIQDPEPDENGLPGQTYRTILAALIPVQKDNQGLPPHPRGAHVLARYPETTTFYKAEVMATKKETCMLRFEGEDEIEKLTEVERRLVLKCGCKSLRPPHFRLQSST